MTVLKWMTIIYIAYIVIYIILKVMAVSEQSKIPQEPAKKQSKPKTFDVEITSKDLYLRAENLINMHDIYGYKAEQLSVRIKEIEHTIDTERNNKSILRMPDTEIKALMSESLELQEKKCKIEAKIIKILEDLDKIAIEQCERRIRNQSH